MRILKLQPQEAKNLMREIGVDPCGIKIMFPKAIAYPILLDDISNIAANILKQELLALGADAALARGSLTGQVKRTKCLMLANLSQFNQLIEKLNRQPFGLGGLAKRLAETIKNYQKDKFEIELGRFKLNLGAHVRIMGILNLTPDSFSNDGLYYLLAKKNLAKILEIAQKLCVDGADILDVGGESSRPGACPITVKQEIQRVIPVVKLLAKSIKIPISVDTYKPQVADAALSAGAVLVNDISGLRSLKMAKIIAKHKAAAVLMHMRGKPATMQNSVHYNCLIPEIMQSLSISIKRAEDSGINPDKIIIDPGIGFGKELKHNLRILEHLSEFKVLGKPIMVGTSRKSFIGKITKTPPGQRVFGSIASCVWAALSGAQIVRAHDVRETKQGLIIINTPRGAGYA